MTGRWEHLEHGADIGVRGYGESLEQAFSQAARAMSSVITSLDRIDTRDSVEIECSAAEPDLLLLDWLNEIIYLMATRHMLFGRFEVRISGHHLRARLFGEALDRGRHQPAVEIKGATFTELKVYQAPHGEWVAQCVIDV